MKEIPTREPLNRIQTACVSSNAILEMMHKNDYENTVSGIHIYSFIIRGKGKMSGKEFADRCREVYSDKNPANASYYELFAKHITHIERHSNGHIHVGFHFS